MATVKQALEEITSNISAAFGSNARVAVEYTGEKTELPLSSLHIATGVRNASVKRVIVDDAVSIKKTITIEATMLLPKRGVGMTLVDAIDKILTVAQGCRYTLQSFDTNSARYSSSLGAIVQSIYIKVSI